MFVGRVIVDDQMQIDIGRSFFVDLFEKTEAIRRGYDAYPYA